MLIKSKIMNKLSFFKRFFNFLAVFSLFVTLSNCGGVPEFAKPSKTLLFDSENVAKKKKNWIDEWLTASTK